MKKRKIRKIALSFLAVIFVFAPLRLDIFHSAYPQALAFETLIINQDTTWKKDDNILINKAVRIKDGATLVIEKGAVVRFAKDGDMVPSISIEDGRIVAEGSESEKITFTTASEDDQYGMSFYDWGDNEASFFRYVEFLNGGYVAYPVAFKKQDRYIQKAYAYGFPVPVISYSAGKVHMENSLFKNSINEDVVINYGIGEDNKTDYFEIVNSNFEGTNADTAVRSKIYCYLDDEDECESKKENVKFTNNWYGSILGPTEDGDSGMLQKGKRIAGDYELEGWKSNDLIADPAVVIPGIMGSAQVMGEWKLDPILHTYDDLIKSLKTNGYENGKNLFVFPYNWRSSNKVSALHLQGKIEEIMQKTHVSKVDIVAHSMGGLVTRAYVEEIEGTQYNDTIDQLITMGTPHRGSPEAYLKWEAGEGFFRWQGFLARHHFEQEAEEAGYNNDLKNYIRNEVVSVKELLPDYDYLFDVPKNQMREYSEGYPGNVFLEDLNNERNLNKLDSIRFVNIVGNPETENTIAKIRVVNDGTDSQWEHGMPENFYNKETDRGLVNGRGDETVPIESAKDINSDKLIEMGFTHGELPSKAQCEVFREFTGLQECKYDEDLHIPNLLLFNVFSPVDIQIIQTDTGKRIGKDFATGELINEIPGAFYSGFDTENEYITIPNPEDGEYQILTQGTGNGNYKIEATKISENEDGSASESVANIEGVAQENIIGEPLKVKVEGNVVVAEETRDTTPPVIEITSPEAKEYLNNQTIDFVYSVMDNLSPQSDVIIQKYLDDQQISDNKIDLSMLSLGNHALKIIATDNAGNIQEKEIAFSTTTSLQAIKDNVQKYYDAKLIRSKQQKNVLLVSLEIIEQRLAFLEMIKNNPHISQKAKNMIAATVKKQIEQHVEFLIKQINHQQKYYDAKIKQLLIEDLQWLENNAVK